MKEQTITYKHAFYILGISTRQALHYYIKTKRLDKVTAVCPGCGRKIPKIVNNEKLQVMVASRRYKRGDYE